MEDPLKRWQRNVHNGTVHERERRTQDRNQQDGSAIRFRTRMLVGFEASCFGTWDRLWGANPICVVHGSLLEGHRHSKSTEVGSVQDHDHNAVFREALRTSGSEKRLGEVSDSRPEYLRDGRACAGTLDSELGEISSLEKSSRARRFNFLFPVLPFRYPMERIHN